MPNVSLSRDKRPRERLLGLLYPAWDRGTGKVYKKLKCVKN